jgi:hypothetical protein
MMKIDNPDLMRKAKKYIQDNYFDPREIHSVYTSLGGSFSEPEKKGGKKENIELKIGDDTHSVFKTSWKQLKKPKIAEPKDDKVSEGKSLLKQVYSPQKVAENYKNVVSHLEGQGHGDVPANKIKKTDELYKYSNPKKVQQNIKSHYGNLIVYKSNNPKKKYMVQDDKGKWVHFGAMGMQDFTKHLDPVRQTSYLKRATNIKGKWRENILSPNCLAILGLWV